MRSTLEVRRLSTPPVPDTRTRYESPQVKKIGTLTMGRAKPWAKPITSTSEVSGKFLGDIPWSTT
jgi:hypothetical protein